MTPKQRKTKTAYERERRRLHRLHRFEEAARAKGFRLVGGIDEVGRGPLAGPVVAACVVKREDVTESELIRHCGEYLASFKVPARIEFVDELPRNPIGKFVRRALLPYFESKSAPIASKRNV